MAPSKPEPLLDSLRAFDEALREDSHGRETQWTANVYAALGNLANVMQEEVRLTKKSSDMVDEVNPDFATTPTVERQVQNTRECQIRLREEMFGLRDSLRRGCNDTSCDVAALRERGQKLAHDIEKMRSAKMTYLFDAVNSNPGSGE